LAQRLGALPRRAAEAVRLDLVQSFASLWSCLLVFHQSFHLLSQAAGAAAGRSAALLVHWTFIFQPFTFTKDCTHFVMQLAQRLGALPGRAAEAAHAILAGDPSMRASSAGASGGEVAVSLSAMADGTLRRLDDFLAQQEVCTQTYENMQELACAARHAGATEPGTPDDGLP